MYSSVVLQARKPQSVPMSESHGVSRHVLSRDSWGESIPCFFQLLMAADISCIVTMSF